MKRILLTGFEAFAGNESNPTEDLMIDLAKSGHRSLVLPVSFARSWKTLKKVLESEKPQWVISCGVAAKRETIDLERVALNFMDAGIKDNDGFWAQEQVINPHTPSSYLSELPLNQWRDQLSSDFPVKVSLSAGSFVCNYLYYQLRSHEKEGGFHSLFIHFPYYQDKLNRELFLHFMESFLSLVEKFDSD